MAPFVNSPLPPAFDRPPEIAPDRLRPIMTQAVQGWLHRTPSHFTRVNYARDLSQFLSFSDIAPAHLESLTAVLPQHIAAWRDALHHQGMTNATIRRKLTALRSLFSYLQRASSSPSSAATRIMKVTA
jgi:integrase/recombinase XerD